jgi:hypothetical protein
MQCLLFGKQVKRARSTSKQCAHCEPELKTTMLFCWDYPGSGSRRQTAVGTGVRRKIYRQERCHGLSQLQLAATCMDTRNHGGTYVRVVLMRSNVAELGTSPSGTWNVVSSFIFSNNLVASRHLSSDIRLENTVEVVPSY